MDMLLNGPKQDQENVQGHLTAAGNLLDAWLDSHKQVSVADVASSLRQDSPKPQSRGHYIGSKDEVGAIGAALPQLGITDGAALSRDQLAAKLSNSDLSQPVRQAGQLLLLDFDILSDKHGHMSSDTIRSGINTVLSDDPVQFQQLEDQRIGSMTSYALRDGLAGAVGGVLGPLLYENVPWQLRVAMAAGGFLLGGYTGLFEWSDQNVKLSQERDQLKASLTKRKYFSW